MYVLKSNSMGKCSWSMVGWDGKEQREDSGGGGGRSDMEMGCDDDSTWVEGKFMREEVPSACAL
jgi:hypothetical protein